MRSGDPVERLTDSISTAVAERQRLRESTGDRGALERNRRRLVRLQWELSHALIARHAPRAA